MEIQGGIGIKGVLLAEDPVSVEVVEVKLEPEGKVVLQMGSARIRPGAGPVGSDRLVATAGPPGVDDVSLGIWLPRRVEQAEEPGGSPAETEKRLRALGYLD